MAPAVLKRFPVLSDPVALTHTRPNELKWNTGQGAVLHPTSCWDGEKDAPWSQKAVKRYKTNKMLTAWRYLTHLYSGLFFSRLMMMASNMGPSRTTNSIILWMRHSRFLSARKTKRIWEHEWAYTPLSLPHSFLHPAYGYVSSVSPWSTPDVISVPTLVLRDKCLGWFKK